MGVQFAGNILVQANGGPLPISQGGTGQTTAPTAINALLPTQTGNSGKVLTTDGTNVSWANGGVTAGGSDTQIQFNDSGSLGGLASLVINKSTGALTGTSTFTNAGTNITGAAATYRPVKFQTAGSDRWIMQANNAAETGSAAGSNFEFIRVADNGATTNQVFTVARNSGVVDFKTTPTINGVAIGTGAGTVTSVAVSSANNAISVSGSPVTSSGTITVTANTFTSTNPGVVSASGGGTSNFLRADGTWAAPSAASKDAGTLTGTTLAANVVNASLEVIQPAATASGTNGDGISLTGGQSAGGNTTGGTVSLVGGTYTGSGSGGGVSLTGGLSATAAGGAITLTGGNSGSTSGTGGAITITGGGVGNGANSRGGGVTIAGGGTGTGGQAGSDVTISGGQSGSSSNAGGSLILRGGLNANAGGGGPVIISTGGSAYTERLRITGAGAWQLAGLAGTTGQYLTANSAGAPTWSSFFSSGNPTIGVGAANLSWYTAGASWRGIDIQNANGENISIVTRASNNQAVYGYNWYQNSSGTLVYTTTNAASRMIYDAPTQSWSFASAPSGTAGTTPTFTTYATIGTTTLTAPSFTSTVATGTAPLTVSSTTVVPNLNVSQLLGSTWVSPGAIGSTTANTGAFTTLTAQSLNTTGSTAPANGVYLPAANSIGISTGSTEGIRIDSSGNLLVQRVGSGLRIKEGTNAKMGVATLVAGTVTVSNTSVTANSRIFLTTQSVGGTAGFLVVSARTAGTSFTILSSSNTDTSVVAWMIVEPA